MGPTITRLFSIPQPIIPSSQGCEYMVVKYRKVSPIVSTFTTLPNLFGNQFSLELDKDSVYEIISTHHCCDGSDSQSTSIQYNTSSNAQMVYACLQMVDNTDTCMNTSGDCRNCKVSKIGRLKFYSDLAGTMPLDITGRGMVVKYQNTENSVISSILTSSNLSGTFFDLLTIDVYEEQCNPTTQWSTTFNRSLNLLNGSNLPVPYVMINCPGISSNPNIFQTSNYVSSGKRIQTFKIGSDVASGNKFSLTVYSHQVLIIANSSDTASTIASKLSSAIMATTAIQWNDFNSAPIAGTPGFKPTSEVTVADSTVLSITLNQQNQFASYASVN